MRKHVVLLASLATVTLVGTACGGNSSSQSSGHGGAKTYADGGTFTMAIPDDLPPADPYRHFSTYSHLAYDSLVNLRADGTFVSGLARSWKADATSATFTLRPDVTCSDGTPLKATQVADDLNYVGDPQNKATIYGTLVPTVPYTAKADDATGTVSITMKQPFGLILNTIGVVPIVCSHGLRDPDALTRASDGTGPFVLDQVESGSRYTFTVRHGYTWGPNGASTSAPGTPDKVVVRVVTNETTRANLLRSGELNFADVRGPDASRMRATGLSHVDRGISGGWLWFNERGDRPWADLNVRTALTEALDLNQLIKVNVGESGGGPATGLVESRPKPCAGDTVKGALPTQNVDAAKSLLDKAGWTVGPDGIRQKGGKRLTIDLHYVPTISTQEEPTSVLLSQQWGKLGIDVKLSADSLAKVTEIFTTTSNFDVLLYGFGLSLPTQMVPYATGQVPPAGANLAGIHNDAYGSLAAQAQAMPLPQACGLWEQAEKALWHDLNPVPIAYRPEVYYLNKAESEIAGWSLPIPTSIRLLR